MGLWEKIKQSFSGGVETISDKTTEWSSVARLRWEHHGVRREIEKSLTELGDMVYQLHTEGKDDQIIAESKGLVQQIEAFEEQLVEKEEEIKELTEKGVDPHQLKELRKDLELGDGAIDQVVIADSSKMIGKKLMEINFPENVLIGAIVRDDKVIIPDGQTVIQEGDKLTLIGEKDDIAEALSLF